MTNLAERIARVPRTCVWEITTACMLRCVHCELSAGAPRRDELSTAEMLALAESLADAGCQNVSLTGGEPLLRADWPQIARRLVERSIEVKIVSNGLLVDEPAVRRMLDAGVAGAAVSLDGDRETHDAIRVPAAAGRGRPAPFSRPGRPSPEGTTPTSSRYDSAIRAIELLASSTIRTAVITQVNKRNIEALPEIYELLARLGVDAWQVQLAYPLGRLLSCTWDYLIEPAALPGLEATLAGFARDGRVAIVTADNIGYYGSNEPLLRYGPKGVRTFWTGCMAGCLGVCILSNGDVKGCPTHPDQFIVGNVRREPFADIWSDPSRFPYNTEWDESLLEGECAACGFRRVCRAGCTTMAFAVTGTIYDNPFCIQRAGIQRAGSS